MKVDCKQVGTYSRLVLFIIFPTLRQKKQRNEKKIVGIMCILVSIILIACNINAQEIDFSGTWKGTCFNQTIKVGADIKVFMVHKGYEATGYMKVSPPFLFGSGPFEGKYDWETDKFSAKVKCKGVLIKLLFGGATIYFDAAINIRPDKEDDQLIVDMKGPYRFKPRWGKDQVGIFSITKKIQVSKKQNTTFRDVSAVFTTKHSNMFHKSDCSELDTGNLLEFDSKEEAVASGGVPCKDCDP